MLSSAAIVRVHDLSLIRWHAGGAEIGPPETADEPLASLTLAQHRANFELWHEEDKARSPDATDAAITTVKHAIDHLNQRRNDLAEQLDVILLEHAGTQNPQASLNSESPGLIIDRLSILALKIYHTREECERVSASADHRARNLERLSILELQRADLACCLDELWVEVLAGRRRFRLYRQMKMYNDPDLNPVLYARTLPTPVKA